MTFLKRRWILIAVTFVFIILKLPHLHYAYYWDECWPYAVAIKTMYNNGISLMPGAIPGELSRGHPLLFHALAASWMKLFGGSHLAMHSFALLISVSFLVFIYESATAYFDQRVATINLLLVATQSTFFIQSSYVLFEVLVAFLSFASICLYVRRQYLVTALVLTALFYTKESGMIAGFVLGLDALVTAFNRQEPMRNRIARLAAVGTPVLLIGVFFILQKQINGWYILPLYNDLADKSWGLFWYDLKTKSVDTLFTKDLRNYYFFFILAMSVMAFARSKKRLYLFLFIPAIIVYYCSDDMRSGRLLPGIPFFILFIASVVALLMSLERLNMFRTKEQKKMVVLMVSFIFCFMCFSAMNFFTPRYLLAAIVPLLFFAAILLDHLAAHTPSFTRHFIVPVLLLIGAFSFYYNDGYGDTDPGGYDGLAVQQDVVTYLETTKQHHTRIANGSFLRGRQLTDPGAGFLHSNDTFSKVIWEINDSAELAIFDNIENDYRYPQMKSNPSFSLIKRFQHGRIWAEVYQKKH